MIGIIMQERSKCEMRQNRRKERPTHHTQVGGFLCKQISLTFMFMALLANEGGIYVAMDSSKGERMCCGTCRGRRRRVWVWCRLGLIVAVLDSSDHHLLWQARHESAYDF